MHRGPLLGRAIPHLAAVGVVALALVVRVIVDPLLGDRQAFVTFYLAIAAAAWLYGLPAAITAIVVSYLAADWFVVSPRGSFNILHLTSEDAVGVAFYVASGGLIAVLAHRARAAQRQAMRDA